MSLDSHTVAVGWGDTLAPSLKPSPSGAEDGAVFAPDFYLQTATPWLRTAHSAILSRADFQAIFEAEIDRNADVKDELFQWLEPEIKGFEKSWLEIQRGFRERGLVKAVPVVYATAPQALSSARRASVLRSLLRQPGHLYIYGAWSSESGDGILGATPEILFTRLPGQALQSMALAGTRAKTDADAAERLLADQKEQREHALVVSDLRERLGTLGNVTVGATRALELPTLFHLHTPLSVDLVSELSLEELVRSLHPTPALGLSPRALGFAEMRRWDESRGRGRFGAPFAVSLGGIQHCVVAIRGVQWAGQRTSLGSGCGVVAESDFDREWQELKLKRESVKRMLSL